MSLIGDNQGNQEDTPFTSDNRFHRKSSHVPRPGQHAQSAVQVPSIPALSIHPPANYPFKPDGTWVKTEKYINSAFHLCFYAPVNTVAL